MQPRFDIPAPKPKASSIRVEDWLIQLDNSNIRKHPTIIYSECLSRFTNNDVWTLKEVKKLGRDGLEKIGFLIGTAQRLLDYAEEDSQ